MADITGTSGSDTLEGTAGADVINGLSGFDRIDGKAGDDVINGGGDGDNLQGGTGNDVIDGGDGNDSITDDGGSDTVRGGAGDDSIRIGRTGDASFERVSVDAGTGNDSFTYQNYRSGSLVANMGDGDDAVDLIVMQNGGMRFTLGAGRDTISFNSLMSSFSSGTLVITDFATGATGDQLDIAEWLNKTLVNWDGSANPFGPSGYLRLAQQGSSTLLQIDRDGASGSQSFGTLVTFENTSATAFTTENFDGLPPDGSAVPGRSITGTSGSDTLEGTAGADVINGLSGFDRIDGKAGDDVINGGGDGDNLQGGTGNDVIDGGDGNDSITDDGGSDTVRGGAGDDSIRIGRTGDASFERVSVDAGTGNDSFTYQNYRSGSLVANMGDGDDAVDLIVMQNGGMRFTLGAGRDTISFNSLMSSFSSGTLVITDFATGATGDQLDIAEWLNKTLVNWDGSANPFGPSGYLRLAQQGSSTLLQIDRDGASGSQSFGTLVTFENTSATAFTTENFDGLPPDGSAVPGRSITGTSGSDTLEGTAGADVINGLSGFDRIDGKAGDDVINGGGDGDNLQGGTGNDVIDGGDGNDSITDDGGSDTVRGGAGDDSIRIGRTGDASFERVSVDAGTGNDSFTYQNYRSGSLVANMGDGDDAVDLIVMQNGGMRFTLGAGRDTISFNSLMSSFSSGTLVITDFATGATGDQLDIAEWLNKTLVNWDGSANPFGPSGYLRLAQQGSSTLLQIDRDGASGSQSFGTLVTFENTSATAFTTENFDGYMPRVGTPTEISNATISAPASITEGAGNTVNLSLTLKDVGSTTVNTNVTVSFAADRSTATNGSDADVSAFSGSYSVAQSPTGNYTIALPSAAVLDDLLAEGTEKLAIRITASGRVFDTGTDTTVVTISLLDNDGTAAADVLTGTDKVDRIEAGAGDDRVSGLGGADDLRGGDGNDVLDGGDGGDTLIGAAGADRMIGGAGDDFYLVEDAGDRVIEAVGQGQDTVVTSISYTLDAGQSVDIFRATSGTLAPNSGQPLNLTGNELGQIIEGNYRDNILSGMAGNDWLRGYEGNDVLRGGADPDTLVGGSGADVFAGTAAELAGDTITDLAVGDRIRVDAASSDGFQYTRINGTLSFGGGAAVTLSGVNLSLVTRSVEGGVELVAAAHEAHANDFTADGHGDLLWRNGDTGAFSTWGVTGNGPVNGFTANLTYDGSVGLNWKLQGSLDWNGDGVSDIAWREAGGSLTFWSGTGTGGFTANSYAIDGVGADWKIAATGDFNRDGRDDLIWRNTNGSFTEWQSTGAGYTANVYSNAGVPIDWKLAGTTDLDGDGRDDLVWRNESTGHLSLWTSTGDGFNFDALTETSVGTDWQIAALADFNGDGRGDILWRNTATGVFTEWSSTGAGFRANTYYDATVSTDWQLVQAADANGDGMADLFWRNVDTGHLTVWQSTGDAGFIANTGYVASVSTDWDLIGAAGLAVNV